MYLLKSNLKIFVLLLFQLLEAKNSVSKNYVSKLTDSNFEKKLKVVETAFVVFYMYLSPNLEAKYERAAKILNDQKSSVRLFRVNCDNTNSKTCQKYAYKPLELKIFRNGEFSQEYNGPIEISDIVKYMKNQAGPISLQFNNKSDFNKYIKAVNQITVVGFFSTEIELKSVFLKVALRLTEKIKFAHVLEKQGVNNSIILFRPRHMSNIFENDAVTYTGKPTIDAIKNFILTNCHGLVAHRTLDNAKDFRNPLLIAYYKIDYIKNAKNTNYWRNKILKVAHRYKNKCSFVVSDSYEFYHEIRKYEINLESQQPLILAKDVFNKVHIFNETLSTETLEKFVSDLLSNKRKPYLKSETTPKEYDNRVKIATAKNFDEVVINNGKDTFILFYVPWCTDCVSVSDIFVSLAKELRDDDIDFVKMNVDANDVPPAFEVKAFPTAYWLGKNSKNKHILYEDGDEGFDYLKFVAKHATSELKVVNRQGILKSKAEL